ncbi:Asg1 protein [Maudiozyma humilis]|uniref:Asg1 protein n=1 Tax=Maudiozyma humilis TaxID=51915 RepID=A0AAV5S191_MAUHU|nr:Asg1 protein [Kazachstania humilis]
MISKDTVSPTNYQSPWLASPEMMTKNQYASSANSADSMLDNGDNQRSSSVLSPGIGREIKIMLPPRNIALQFVKNTWKYCCVLLRFYHRPLFIEQLNELYDTEPNNYTQKQIQFLPLCYSIMAVGALFSKSLCGNDDSKSQDSESNTGIDPDNKFMQDEGYKYFIAARKLIDITNTRDINSIQTVVMLFIFLQCSARLSTCYAYIGVAMRSVLREGYHRLTPENSGLNPIEIEVRKRLFYTIYKLDVYVNAMLGLPRSISTDDFDQILPIELSDENITAEGYHPENQHGVLSSVAVSNHHTKLIMILNDIVKDLYPIKKTSNIISHETVTNLEAKLQNWIDQLPPEMKPNGKNISQKYERANKLLHLSFLHVQIILYRPFIHYVSHKYRASSPDPLSLQRARNCINVSRAVVTLAQDTLNKSLIAGSYWYANYTIFYSVAGLLFYTHEAEPYDKESAREYYDILKDAEVGRNLLMRMKDTSMAANRTYNILNKLFEKLNTRTIQLLYPWDGKPAQNLTSNFPSESSDSSSAQKYSGNEGDGNQSNNVPSKSENESASVKREGSAVPTVSMDAVQSNPMNTTNDSMNSMFNFSTGANDILPSNSAGGDVANPAEGPNLSTSNQISSNGTTHTSIKFQNNENDNTLGVLNVFDQLDAQLFGKYSHDNNFENAC